VTIKLTIVVVLSGAVLFVLIPALRAQADAVIGAAPRTLGDASRFPLVLAPTMASALLAIALALAIFKPDWRIDSSFGRRTEN